MIASMNSNVQGSAKKWDLLLIRECLARSRFRILVYKKIASLFTLDYIEYRDLLHSVLRVVFAYSTIMEAAYRSPRPHAASSLF